MKKIENVLAILHLCNKNFDHRMIILFNTLYPLGITLISKSFCNFERTNFGI